MNTAHSKISTVNIVSDGFYEPVVFVGDAQIPYQDDLTLMVVEKFLKDFQPKKLINLGDHFDFYSISHFNRDPERRFKLQEEIDEGVDILKRWRSILPKAEFTFLSGNHEERLKKYLWSQAPELASLRALDLKELLSFKDLGIKSYDYGDAQYVTPAFIAEHGNIARQYSGYTAKAMLDRRGVSGISGHSHRLGLHFRRDRGGTKVWGENGCLCSLKPEYDPFPNWQQGFTVGWFKKSGYRFHLEQLSINDHAFVYGGKRYGIL